MNTVRIGIVGIGNMGSVHAKSIFGGNIKGLELVAVCDTDKNKLDWARKNLDGVRLFEEYKEMVDENIIDAILIATPHYIHPEIAIYSFSKKLHVLCEKPAGVFTKQVVEMNQAAQKANTVFSMMYNQRTNPIYKQVRDMVKAGRLGELKRCVWIITNWYRTQTYYDSGNWRGTWAGEGGGVLINQCPHNLDLWQWILGMPAEITGFCDYGKYHDIEVEDDVTAYAKYDNGATAVFITTTGEYPGTNRMEIDGDKGKMVIEDRKIKFWELETSEREVNRTSQNSFVDINSTYQEIIPEGEGTGHNGILQNFANSILFGEELIAPGIEGINGLTISNAIHLSDWTKEKIVLPIDEQKFIEHLQERIRCSQKKDHVKSQTADLANTYSSRWDIKW